MLDAITKNIDTEVQDDPSNPLGTLQSGAGILSNALKSFPELTEAAYFVAVVGGGEEEKNITRGNKYNGTIDALGQPVEIKDGIGEIEGRKIYVSPNGEFVADDKGQIIGKVENGKFGVIDKAHAQKLEQAKLAERRAQ